VLVGVLESVRPARNMRSSTLFSSVRQDFTAVGAALFLTAHVTDPPLVPDRSLPLSAAAVHGFPYVLYIPLSGRAALRTATSFSYQPLPS